MTKLSTHEVLGQAGIYRAKKSVIPKMLTWICHPTLRKQKQLLKKIQLTK
jgi:hypothetical protein